MAMKRKKVMYKLGLLTVPLVLTVGYSEIQAQTVPQTKMIQSNGKQEDPEQTHTNRISLKGLNGRLGDIDFDFENKCIRIDNLSNWSTIHSYYGEETFYKIRILDHSLKEKYSLTLKGNDPMSKLNEFNNFNYEDRDYIELYAVEPSRVTVYLNGEEQEQSKETKQVFQIKGDTLTRSTNNPPVLKVNDKTINLGDSLELKDLIEEASDVEEGDLIDKVTIDPGMYSSSKHGVYRVAFSVTDSNENSVTKIAKVTVIDPAYVVKKQIDISPGGDVTAHVHQENRSARHSDIQSTGLFLKKGQSVKIKCSGAEGKLKAFIGQYGAYSYLNDGKSLALNGHDLKTGVNTVVDQETEGMLYIKNLSENEKATVEIEGGQEVPLFVLGKTTSKEWRSMLETMADAPFVEIVGKHVFGTFQYNTAYPILKNRSVDDLLEYWDKIFLIESHTYGLDLRANGVAHKYPDRIHITNPDEGPGYASATEYRVTFQNSTGAGKDILTDTADKPQWGVWHEIGHTFQTPDYKWDGMGEVTVNIASSAVEKVLGFPNSASYDEDLKKYIDSEDKNKDFNVDVVKLGSFPPLTMFLQLAQAYGDNFYPHLSQKYRLLNSDPDFKKPETVDQKMQLFMVEASETAQCDLTPFFEKWGMHPNDDTKKQMRQWRSLTKPIWDNFYQGTKIIDSELAPYTLPTADIKSTEEIPPVLIGETKLRDLEKGQVGSYLTNLKNLDSEEPVLLDSYKVYYNNISDEKKAQLHINLTNSTKTVNQITVPLNARYGDSLEIISQYDTSNGILTIHPEEKTLSFVGNTNKILHHNYTGKKYLEVSIYDKEHRKVSSISCNGEDSTAKVKKLLNGYHYKNGDIIDVSAAQTSVFGYYSNDVKQETLKDQKQAYQIIDDKLVRLTTTGGSLKAKSISIEQGSSWSKKDLIDWAMDDKGQPVSLSDISCEGADEVNTDKIGQYKVTLHYKDFSQTVTITIKEPLPTYTVKFKAGAHGSLKGTSSFTLKKGKSLSEIKIPDAVADKGYEFTYWKDSKGNKVTDFSQIIITNNLAYQAVFSKKSEDKSAVYRLYNKNTGEHFYTESAYERDALKRVGWNDENIGWYAPKGGTAVYRVYNPNSKGGDHYYTASHYEASQLVKKGWRWDNKAKAVFYSGGTKKIYVAYNPNAASGSHNYTMSSYEQNSLLKNGWKYGKVQFYGK
jgi:hypothetical protein